MGIALTLAGALVLCVGSVLILIAAFRKGVLWGLGSMFLAPVSLFFVVTNWDAAKRGVGVSMLGVLLFFGGGAMTAATHDGGDADSYEALDTSGWQEEDDTTVESDDTEPSYEYTPEPSSQPQRDAYWREKTNQATSATDDSYSSTSEAGSSDD